MNRAEHLQWCKDRAIEYVNDGETTQAYASFVSDMSKHSETMNHPGLVLGAALLFGGHLDSRLEMEKWIHGFN